MLVHPRDAGEDTLSILKEENAERCGGVLHCFSGDPDQARRATDLGFYLGVGGTLSYGDPELEMDPDAVHPSGRKGRRNGK